MSKRLAKYVEPPGPRKGKRWIELKGPKKGYTKKKNKYCPTCDTTKPVSNFYAHRGRPDGLHSQCKKCSVYNARRCKYGLTKEQLLRMLEDANHKCNLCGRYMPEAKFNIDHCHTTGKVRGLLCSACNSGLGLLGDNIEGLERALEYLRKSSAQTSSHASSRDVSALQPLHHQQESNGTPRAETKSELCRLDSVSSPLWV